MASNNNTVYSVSINGNASGLTGAISQALGNFKKLESALTRMSNRAVNVTFNNPNIQKITKSSADISRFQQKMQLEAARQGIRVAEEMYAKKKAAADKFNNDVVKKAEDAYNAKHQEVLTRTAQKKPVKRAQQQESKLHDDWVKKQAEYDKKFGADLIKAEAAVSNAVSKYEKVNTNIVKSELREREKLERKTTDARIAQQKRLVSDTKKASNAAKNALKNSVSQMIQGGMALTNSFRFAMQGVTELANVLSAVIAIPIIGFFYTSFNAATEFETAMMKVSKTTGMTGARLEELRNYIRNFSKTTTSTESELAKYAEELGRLGVVDQKPLTSMIQTIEMMTAATELSADTVSKAIGRIGTAFGYKLNTEEGAAQMRKLANTINMLENTTGASADEIVEGLLNVASTGGMLKIPIQDMAAIVAMMEAMGVSADAVGNRLARWYQNVIAKPAEIAALMKGYQTKERIDHRGNKVESRTYTGSSEDILKWVNEDKTRILFEINEAMANVNDEAKTKALKAYFESFGLVGAKVGVLAGNVEGVADALYNARKEFESGNSLFFEYDKALMTTEAHMKILRNNINDAAVTLGDAFLPIINRVIEYAVPGIQILARAFKMLSWEAKLAVVGIPLLLAVLIPVLFVIAQLGHAVGMFGMALFSMLGGLKTVVFALFNVGKAAFGIIKVFKGVIGIGALLTGGMGGIIPVLVGVVAALALLSGGLYAIQGAAGSVKNALSTIGVDIVGFFTNIGKSAGEWGENLMKTYGNGLITGAANFVAKAVSKIANMIASFFESHSPPKAGPLKEIDKWGGPLFTSFLKGFYLADFGILNEIGGMVKDALHMMFSGDPDEEDSAVGKAFAKVRENMAKLISIYNKTGKIAEDVLNSVVGGTGKLAGEFKKLIKLSLQYERSQRRIKDLEKERAKVETKYASEVARISAMNISAEEKSRLIQEAIANRNSRADKIEEEKKAEEEKSEELKDQLDWQKAFIEAQIDQADIYKGIEKALSKIGDALDNLDFGGAGAGASDFSAKIDNMVTTVQDRLETARRAIGAFFDGLGGEKDPTRTKEYRIALAGGEFGPEQTSEMQKAYDLGVKIRDVYQKIKDIFSGKALFTLPDTPAMDSARKFFEALGALGNIGSEFFRGLSEGLAPLWKAIGEMAQLRFDELMTFLDWVSGNEAAAAEGNAYSLADAFYEVGKAIGHIASALALLSPYFGPGKVMEWLNGSVGGNGRVGPHGYNPGDPLVPGEPLNLFGLGGTGGGSTGSGGGAGLGGGGLGGKTPGAGGINGASFVNPVITGMSTALDNALKIVQGKWDGIKDTPKVSLADWWATSVSPYFAGVGTGMDTWFGTNVPAASTQWNTLRTDPDTALANWWSGVFQPKFGEVWTGITTWFTTNTALMSLKWDAFRDTMVTSMKVLPEKVAVVFTSITAADGPVAEGLKTLNGWFNGVGTGFATAVQTGWDAVSVGVANAMATLIEMIAAKISDLLDQYSTLKGIWDGLSGGGGGGGGGGSRTAPTSNGVEKDEDGKVIRRPKLGAGGVTTGPTWALIGEAKEQEAVIPLSKLPGLIGKVAMPVADGGGNTVIFQIQNASFKDENDMKKFIRMSKREMESALANQRRMRGRS